MRRFIKKVVFSRPIAARLSRIFVKINSVSYKYLGPLVVAAEGGIHPKHRLINYHSFFVENINEGENVLDIGCGNGVFLKDIYFKTRARALGIDVSLENVDEASKRFVHFPEVTILHSDIHLYDEETHFDVIILSNVLEHLDNRSALLRSLSAKFSPRRFFIRVPMFERDWLVPYKIELGLDWRLDQTHKIEYTETELRRELTEAQLEIDKMVFKWGEMYIIAIPSRK